MQIPTPTETTLIQGAAALSITISPETAVKFTQYLTLLKDWNNRINLTAITEDADIITKHFLDSLTIAKIVKKSGKIIDVGTGAGFPGIPLKLIRPNLNMLLLDSLNKRVNFLNTVISELNLTDIQTIHARAEDLSRQLTYRETFDYATARAMAPMAALAEYCLPYVVPGGLFIAMKGAKCEEELADAQNLIKELGGQVQEIQQVHIPGTDIIHRLVIIEKVSPTPTKYPGKAKQIGKGAGKKQ